MTKADVIHKFLYANQQLAFTASYERIHDEVERHCEHNSMPFTVSRAYLVEQVRQWRHFVCKMKGK